MLVRNTWSDAARQAAALARKSRAHGPAVKPTGQRKLYSTAPRKPTGGSFKKGDARFAAIRAKRPPKAEAPAAPSKPPESKSGSGGGEVGADGRKYHVFGGGKLKDFKSNDDPGALAERAKMEKGIAERSAKDAADKAARAAAQHHTTTPKPAAPAQSPPRVGPSFKSKNDAQHAKRESYLKDQSRQRIIDSAKKAVAKLGPRASRSRTSSSVSRRRSSSGTRPTNRVSSAPARSAAPKTKSSGASAHYHFRVQLRGGGFGTARIKAGSAREAQRKLQAKGLTVGAHIGKSATKSAPGQVTHKYKGPKLSPWGFDKRK